MRDFATSLLVEKDIKFNFEYHGLEMDKKLPVQIRQNVFLIFKEAINNAFKHSNATIVNVELNNERNTFIMIIKDNGEGFDPGENTKGNGFKNMKLRAARIKAEIDITIKEGVELKLQTYSI
jgi:signal transduction histidine kinase